MRQIEKYLALAVGLLVSLSAAAQCDTLFVCHGQQAYRVALSSADVCTFTQGRLRLGLSDEYALSHIDSITMVAPGSLQLVDRGWRGSIDNGESWFYSDFEGRVDQMEGVPFYFRAEDGVCTMATRMLRLLFASKEEFEQFFNHVQDAPAGSSGKFRFVKRTLTRRRKRDKVLVGKPSGMILLDFDKDALSCTLSDIYTDMLSGRSMADVQRIVYAWTHPDTDAAALPTSVQFGSFADGHYSIDLTTIAGFIRPFTITIDFQYSADGKRITGDVITINTRGSWMDADEQLADYADLQEEGVSVEQTDNAIVITETCDMNVEEAMETLVRIDLDIMFPEYCR